MEWPPTDSRTPSERYAASQRRSAASRTGLARFQRKYPFDFDEFQIKGCQALEQGRSVLVAAPTGSGKTIVGEFAVYLALDSNSRAFYTTPIKALSNQKYRDLCELFGSSEVGLLTGDTVINGDASVVVMTTEVLRNMIYEKSAGLAGLTHVVMDEVHYLADRQRGAVWEEVILQLPESTVLTALSATVSNAEEFGAWLDEVRGSTEIVVEEHRPVPLHQHVLVRHGMYDLFVASDEAAPRVNPALSRSIESRGRGAGRGRNGNYRARGRRDFVHRGQVIDALSSAGMLPAIVFIFSRRACDDAVDQAVSAGVRLTTATEARAIAEVVDSYCDRLPESDLAVLGFDQWREALMRGVAAHHAGLLPLFKEVVEQLFSQGMIKIVYATETLALGINMPARTVVLERLIKWDGTSHVDITAGEYTQLTGRAGRRGIDHEGHAVTVYHDGLDPAALAGLASRRTYQLRSSFRPSYNMAVNLIAALGYQRARDLLESSFAQFQADASVVGLANKIRKHEVALAGYQESMTCHLGDFTEYAELRQQITDAEKAASRGNQNQRRRIISSQLGALKRGDVISLARGRRTEFAVVVEQARPEFDDPRPQVLGEDRRVRRISSTDVSHEVTTVGNIKVPKDFTARSANSRRDLARTLSAKARTFEQKRPTRPRAETGSDEEIIELRAQLRAHPCHGCHDRDAHARWANRYAKLAKETAQLKRQIAGATGSLVRQFDAVCEVLTQLGYLGRADDGYFVVQPDAQLLAGLYCEQDLLAAECIRTGLWSDLLPEELAGAVSALVFESRAGDDDSSVPLPPSRRVRETLARQSEEALDLAALERQFRVANVHEPDDGFVMSAWAWCKGDTLAQVLGGSDLAVGDFVRWNRQLVDLLGQIAVVAETERLRTNARSAADSIQRGIVAYTSTPELAE